MDMTRTRSLGSVLLTLALLVTACSVGPNYVRPDAPMTAAYKEDGDWHTAQPRDDVLRSGWWELYDDPVLSGLEEQVAPANQNLAAAEARFRQARTLVWQARSNWYPTVNLGVSFARSRVSSTLRGGQGFGVGSVSSDYTIPGSISWELDLWGKIRRQVESNEASAQASAADLANTQLSLQSQLAVNYFQLRTLDAQRQVLDDTARGYERSLVLTKNRHDNGIASGADVAQAETQLESTRAQATALGVQRAALEHAIAVLMGKPPAEFSLPEAELASTPPPIPVGVPSALLERRPDVATAERDMASANAAIGVAVSAWYPTVTLSGSGGFESGDVAKWLMWPSRFWSAGPSISETIYDAGRRSAQTEQARAAYDETVANYRQTVLTSFQEVEDQLAALRILEQQSEEQARAVKAAQDSVRLTTNQYEGGIVSYLNVVVVNATALNNEQTAVNIQGQRLAASVQLVSALGGGWSAGELPSTRDLAAGKPWF
jgi:NodT family efflux transporter outer membrane factor (OMF) lipoprotein